MIRKILLSLSLLLLHVLVFAQDTNGIEMADKMRSNGKIYVVAAVVLTILTGLILYLVRLDRKISRLEKNIHS